MCTPPGEELVGGRSDKGNSRTVGYGKVDDGEELSRFEHYAVGNILAPGSRFMRVVASKDCPVHSIPQSTRSSFLATRPPAL